MSDAPDSATPAPEPPADSQPLAESRPPATPDAPSGGSEPPTPQVDEEQKRKAIRIGTQRSGVKPPAAVAKPILPAPPPELLAKAQAASGASTPEATDQAADAAAAGESATGKSGDGSGAPGGGKDKGRRPREKKSRTLVPIGEPPAPRKYPPPNLRSQLSPDLQMEYLEALGEESLDEMIAGEGAEVAAELESESRHAATVISIHRDNVFVEIGGRHQGVVPLHSFPDPPEPGAAVEVAVGRFDAGEGLYELTLPGAAVDVGDWSDVAEGIVVEARVTGHNKGGLECEVNRLRGFIPASQISLYRVENLAEFVDQKLACVVTEANPEKRNLVLSHRAVLERERAESKQQLMASLEVGQTREGTVRSLQNFGAFVDLGGVDGLIHISQLSWDRIKHAEEVLEVGQKVKVKIQKIDRESGKIGLAFRDLSENPWDTAARDFPERTSVKGRVTRITDFGAFVRLGPGVEGLVHISELSHKRVFRVTDVLSEGQQVEVMVVSVDPEAQRISLSLKALEAKPAAAQKEKAEEEAEPETPSAVPKKRKTPLKGGTGGPPTGERFGLKW